MQLFCTQLVGLSHARAAFLLRPTGAIAFIAALFLAPIAWAQSATLSPSITFTNPAPGSNKHFGSAIRGLAPERILIGAEGAGAAYVFGTNGRPLLTLTNPSPSGDSFGWALAPVGTGSIVVGAYTYTERIDQSDFEVGRAYLFATNGALLTTFTNPNPAQVGDFGYHVEGLGEDRVLIGAGVGGVVYLYQTNGTLLQTLNYPGADFDGGFGSSLAAAGDRILIGAPFSNLGAPGAGVAYLYDTNANVLSTFTNPAPASGDSFGQALAWVGTRLVLVTASQPAGSGNGGAAYLFTTNGTLLTTITNPTPSANALFGGAAAGLGSSRFIIGASGANAGAAQSGAVYVYSATGLLLYTLTNPTPALGDGFGWAVGALGGDRILVGTIWHDAGGYEDNGQAHLYSVPHPRLSLLHANASLVLSWPALDQDYQLEASTALTATINWSAVSASNSLAGSQVSVSVPATNSQRFFRLRLN